MAKRSKRKNGRTPSQREQRAIQVIKHSAEAQRAAAAGDGAAVERIVDDAMAKTTKATTAEQLLPRVFPGATFDMDDPVDVEVKSRLTAQVDDSLERMEREGLITRDADGGITRAPGVSQEDVAKRLRSASGKGEEGAALLEALKAKNGGKGPVAGGVPPTSWKTGETLDVTLRVEGLTPDGKPQIVCEGPQAAEWTEALESVALFGDPDDDRTEAAQQMLALVKDLKTPPKDRARLMAAVSSAVGDGPVDERTERAKLMLDALGQDAGVNEHGEFINLTTPDTDAWIQLRGDLNARAADGHEGARRLRDKLYPEDGGMSDSELMAKSPALAFAKHLFTPDGPPLDQAGEFVQQAQAFARRYFEPVWPEDEPMTQAVPLTIREPIDMSYVGLANLAAEATTVLNPPLRCALTGSELDAAATGVKHAIIGAWRVRSNGRTVVRLGVRVEQRTGRDVPRLTDVSPATFEALTQGGPQLNEHATVVPSDVYIAESDRPRWAGARAFDRVWARCMTMASVGYESIERGVNVMDLLGQEEDPQRSQWRGGVATAMSALSGMRLAQEVLVDPDQVNAMPQFDNWEHAEQFARDLALPFEHTFLDMEGPARSCVIVEPTQGDREVVLAVRGAHVSRTPEGYLAVIPFGALTTLEDADSAKTCNPLGTFMFGAKAPEEHNMWATQSIMDNGFMAATICVDPAVIRTPLTPQGRDVSSSDGWLVELLSRKDGDENQTDATTNSVAHTLLDATMEIDQGMLGVTASALTAAATAALQALYLIDMGNVEVAEAGPQDGVSRQVRRQAERRGETIALAVRIHTSTRRYQRGAGDDDGARHIEYSHRFRVRSHVKHFGVQTRMAQARPDLCKPCDRCGSCRRIIVPAFIKGPDTAPLILKSLVVK